MREEADVGRIGHEVLLGGQPFAVHIGDVADGREGVVADAQRHQYVQRTGLPLLQAWYVAQYQPAIFYIGKAETQNHNARHQYTFAPLLLLLRIQPPCCNVAYQYHTQQVEREGVVQVVVEVVVGRQQNQFLYTRPPACKPIHGKHNKEEDGEVGRVE